MGHKEDYRFIRDGKINHLKEEGKMKRRSMLWVALVVGLLLITSTISYSAETKAKVLRLAGLWPPLDPVTLQLKAFADKFNKQASGKYVVEVHPGEELVKVMESIDAVRTGASEMTGWPIGVFASLDKRFAAAEIPFLVNNVEGDAAMQVALMPLYSQFMEKKFNSKAIFSFTCLALDVLSTKPVKTVADWKGLLLQSVSPQSAKFIESMGGSAVPLPFPEAYDAIQKKVVAATMQSSSMMIMFKLTEVGKYVTRGYLIPASIIIAVNMDAFKKMPKDVQNALIEAGKQQQKEANDYFIGVAQENTGKLTKMGVEVYDLPKAERDKWVEKVRPYSDSLLAGMGDFGKEVKKAADKVNSKYPYK
jgi:TRAP-type C4-dicarboxylate transport system substrate-binding protein